MLPSVGVNVALGHTYRMIVVSKTWCCVGKISINRNILQKFAMWSANPKNFRQHAFATHVQPIINNYVPHDSVDRTENPVLFFLGLEKSVSNVTTDEEQVLLGAEQRLHRQVG